MKKLILIVNFTLVSFLADAQLKVISGGHVGVATSYPSYYVNTSSSYYLGNINSSSKFLTVEGASGAVPVLNLQNSLNTDGGTIGGLMFTRTGGQADAHRNIAGIVAVQRGTGYTAGSELQFWTKGGGASNNVMVITNSAYVGIGVSSPQTKLDISAGTADGIRSQVAHTSDYGYGINSYVTRSLTKALSVQLSGTDKFVVYGSGAAWATSWNTLSDKSLKENIEPLKGALGKVLQLQGYSYNYKSSVTGELNPKKQIGLLAQDVEKVLPEVVATNDKGLKGVAYQNLVALLIEAVKEQDKRITQLQNSIDSCCTKNSGKKILNQDGSGMNRKEAALEIALANKNNIILYQNEPNPFDGSTAIRYFIPENITGNAYVVFFDMYGKEINKLEIREKGFGKIEANTENLASGIYSYSIVVNDITIETKKMLKNK